MKTFAKLVLVLLTLFFIELVFPSSTFASESRLMVPQIDPSPVTIVGETFYTTTQTFTYSGEQVLLSGSQDGLSGTIANDAIEIIITNSDTSTRFLYSYAQSSNCIETRVREPMDLTSFFANHGEVSVQLKLKDICGGTNSSSEMFFVFREYDEVILDTGFISPTSHQINLGNWIDPQNAYQDDGLFTRVGTINSGTRAITFSGYNIEIPENSTIKGIAIRLDARSSSGWGSVAVYSNVLLPNANSLGGRHNPLGATEFSYISGGPTDLWRTIWDIDQVKNMKVKYEAANINASHFYDWAAVKVYYTIPQIEEPPTDNSVVLDVPSFKQGLKVYDGVDPIWENQIYDDGDKQSLWCDTNGNGATMAECGCALTSASMVMKYFGVDKLPNNMDLSPETLNNYLRRDSRQVGNIYNSYGFINGNVLWHSIDNVTALANRIYPDQTKLDQPRRENYSLELVKEHIDSGTPVILKVTGKFGIHWVVVKGYDPDTNRLIINDPIRMDNPSEYTYLDELYNPVVADSVITYVETHSDFSSFQVSSVSPFTVVDQFGNVNEQIPHAEYAFDEHVGDATREDEIASATTGVYFLTVKTPSNGNFIVETTNNDPIIITTSNIAGDLVSNSINSPLPTAEYQFIYNEQSAGEEIVQAIDIKVKADSNSKWLNIKNNSNIHVTIFGSDGLPATSIDQTTIRFGKTGNEESLKSCIHDLEDKNNDGLLDLTCKFQMSETQFNPFTTNALLSAKAHDGMSLLGITPIVVK